MPHAAIEQMDPMKQSLFRGVRLERSHRLAYRSNRVACVCRQALSAACVC